MNKELKKYIKKNLKQEKKKAKNKLSLGEILLFPLALLISPFSNKIKSVLFDEDCVELNEKETVKEIKNDSYSNIDLEKKLGNSKDTPSHGNGMACKVKCLVFDEDEEDSIDSYTENKAIDERKKLSIEEDVIPFLKEKGIDVDNNIDDEYDIPPFLRNREASNIDDFIKENNKYNDFQTTLFKMIDERNLIDSDVYNKVHIDRRLFSKIRNDRSYHPSKETILLLGLSMELTEDEIEKLLDSASYSLPRNNHYDLIIRFCFMKGIYKLTDVNDLLEQYNCKLFNY